MNSNLYQPAHTMDDLPSAPVRRFSETSNRQPRSPLFTKLPGELRNEIIRFAVVSDEDVKPEISHSLNVVTRECTAKLSIGSALMQTCKQLRHESAQIYFLENTFHLTEDFFTQPPLDSYEQYEFNERAIGALAYSFGPWASRASRLTITHSICYDTHMYGSAQRRRPRAEVRLSIGRRAQEAGGVYLEHAKAYDVNRTSEQLCCCRFARHATDQTSTGIFELAQGLVRIMDLATVRRSSPRCRSCGLEPVM